MTKLFTKDQCQAAKRYCWHMYSHHTWFCGCVYDRDKEKHVVGVVIRTDPDYKDRYTYVTEHEGVPIRIVKWDPEKHGERYDRKKHR